MFHLYTPAAAIAAANTSVNLRLPTSASGIRDRWYSRYPDPLSRPAVPNTRQLRVRARQPRAAKRASGRLPAPTTHDSQSCHLSAPASPSSLPASSPIAAVVPDGRNATDGRTIATDGARSLPLSLSLSLALSRSPALSRRLYITGAPRSGGCAQKEA